MKDKAYIDLEKYESMQKELEILRQDKVFAQVIDVYVDNKTYMPYENKEDLFREIAKDAEERLHNTYSFRIESFEEKIKDLENINKDLVELKNKYLKESIVGYRIFGIKWRRK